MCTKPLKEYAYNEHQGIDNPVLRPDGDLAGLKPFGTKVRVIHGSFLYRAMSETEVSEQQALETAKYGSFCKICSTTNQVAEQVPSHLRNLLTAQIKPKRNREELTIFNFFGRYSACLKNSRGRKTNRQARPSSRNRNPYSTARHIPS
jgi:hypothetical protein